MQPTGRASSPGAAPPSELRRRTPSASSSDEVAPPRARSTSLDDWARSSAFQQDYFARQQSALERGIAPLRAPMHIEQADAHEPDPAESTRWQRAGEWGLWFGRKLLRLAPLVAVYAAVIATTALVFGLKNFSILDQSRAATLVRILRGEVGQAHNQIIATLQAFQQELNATLAGLCEEFRNDR